MNQKSIVRLDADERAAAGVERLDLPHENVPCALCGQGQPALMFRIPLGDSKHSSVWIDGSQHKLHGQETIVRCRQCGLVYVNPRLAPVAGMLPYSSVEEREYFERTREVRQLAYRALLHQAPRWAGREIKTLLDIGCGDGMLLEIARQMGLESAGTELSEDLIHMLRERWGDAVVVASSLEELPASSYDVITMINVIEHVQDPYEMLRAAAGALRPGGILLVHTINIGGLPARLSGARWRQIEPLSHLYYFSHRTLSQLLEKAHFEPIDRFNLIVSRGAKGTLQRLLGTMGIYIDNGLGIVARKAV